MNIYKNILLPSEENDGRSIDFNGKQKEKQSFPRD
jgi:hypothetical protein